VFQLRKFWPQPAEAGGGRGGTAEPRCSGHRRRDDDRRRDLDSAVNQCTHGILVVRSDPAASDSVIVQLEATGFEVVSTDSSTQGIALLYIKHSVGVVVLLTGRKSEPALSWRKGGERSPRYSDRPAEP
jgi:hypothetical protein